MDGAGGFALSGAQVEIESAVFVREARYGVQIVDFFCAQERQAAQFGIHRVAVGKSAGAPSNTL